MNRYVKFTLFGFPIKEEFVKTHDVFQATVSKSLIKSFYGKAPDYSYWMGCSQGGRQGIMLAQRYPDAYNGIAACSPAMYLTHVLPNIFWPYQAMVNAGSFPHMCEFDSITAAAIAACDGLDGIKDGVVSNPGKCLDTFDPFETINQTLSCSSSKDGGSIKVSREAAQVAKDTWRGLTRKDGKVLWPGVSPAADLTGNKPSSLGLPGVLVTQCKDGTCSGDPYGLGSDWVRYFVAKDPKKDVSHLSQIEFDALVRLGEQEYGSFIDASYADLSAFRAAGGKMIVMQGLVRVSSSFVMGEREKHDAMTDIFLPNIGRRAYSISRHGTLLQLRRQSCHQYPRLLSPLRGARLEPLRRRAESTTRSIVCPAAIVG